jgi:hypothetical protein
MSAANHPDSIQTPNIPSQNMLNLLCSRARAALREATSAARQSGPDSYYDAWHYRLAMEMVRHVLDAISTLDLHDVGPSGGWRDLPWLSDIKI